MKRVVFLLVLSLASALPAAAQVHGGAVNGVVKDQQGGVLPGATVTAQGIDAASSIVTTSDGAYHFLDLAPGSYRITAALSGFTTTIRDSVVVEVGKSVDVPFAMRVASVAETVTVDAPSPIVNASPVGTATNFAHDELTNIPTSRDPFAVVRAVPGVLTERVNVAGNETGQQLITVAKAARPQDTSWTLDGVEITDMASTGQSAIYFNFDNFDEIHVSTASNDIRERTGGLTIGLSVKRGGNQFHGELHGYYTGNSLQASNIPVELKALATPVTDATSDHLTRNSDYGFEFGGPLIKERAWFFGSYAEQNVQQFRRSTGAADRTTLRDPNLKINVQATKKDLVNFLYYNGYKIKDNRALGFQTIELPAATAHQDNYYSSNSLHGLFKIADDRVFNPHLLASAKYAYFNTGFSLTPEGGMDQQAARNSSSVSVTNGAGTFAPSTAYGSVSRSLNARPQHTGTLDLNSFFSAFGASHDLKFGAGFRTVDAATETLWPGNGILALYMAPAVSPSTNGLVGEIFREANGSNRADYLDFYIGDTVTRSRWTIDAALRYDRQWGYADASTAAASPAFPQLLPSVSSPGYRTPYTWKNFSPRVGLLYALDAAGKTTARVSYSQAASQLSAASNGPIGYRNTAGSIAFYVFPWTDANGDGFAQAAEVNTAATKITSGNINTTDPTLFATSLNQIDANLKAPVTRSIVSGIERELLANLAVTATYTYSRTTNLFDDGANTITPRVGVPLTTGYTTNAPVTGTLPDGSPFSAVTYTPSSMLIAANGGGGFVMTNDPGYYIDYSGVELGLVKRMSRKWMARATVTFNNARQHYSDPAGIYNANGNPTGTQAEPLRDGGQYAPQENNGSGNYFLNSKWQVNVNGLYEAPYGIELAANVFGRQGFPFPIVRLTSLGSDTSQNVLVSPQIDTFRHPNVWDTDVRIARQFRLRTVSAHVMFDVFNLFNANTSLVRANNILASNFNALTQNMAPRIARLGVTLGF